MDWKIIIQRDMPVSKWSGGTTTQLYIEPEGFTVRDDFDFRISTATVERGESKFTFFKGYSRLLIILEGELQIKHRDEDGVAVGDRDGDFKTLTPFQPYFFSGDLETISRSENDIVDFNFIWKKELGECEPLLSDPIKKIISFRFNSTLFTYSFDDDKGWELEKSTI